MIQNCLGGTAGVMVTTAGTVDGVFGADNQCALGAFGPLCDLCEEGFSLVYTGQCEVGQGYGSGVAPKD